MSLIRLISLEAESLQIFREVVAECDRPVMLYSIGKDSTVMLHLARKAFYPASPPFPLMHIDTTWKFREMISFRDSVARNADIELLVHTNPQGLVEGVNPFDHGSSYYTDVMKTQALRQALDQHGFTAAFGGARRDEEKSRAKERIYSVRGPGHSWDPKAQRPELWSLPNMQLQDGFSLRVFPLSNWTEADVWQYIAEQQLDIAPLYFAKERPVVSRNGSWIMVDDERMRLHTNEVPQMRMVRFRTLGCYPLSGAIDSTADTLEAIVNETLQSRFSERQGRAIDHDGAGSMERKKQEGYF